MLITYTTTAATVLVFYYSAFWVHLKVSLNVKKKLRYECAALNKSKLFNLFWHELYRKHILKNPHNFKHIELFYGQIRIFTIMRKEEEEVVIKGDSYRLKARFIWSRAFPVSVRNCLSNSRDIFRYINITHKWNKNNSKTRWIHGRSRKRIRKYVIVFLPLKR